MFTGGSDDEAVCIRGFRSLVQARAHRKEGAPRRSVVMSKTQARPHLTLQKNISAVSVPARGGYSAMSIQDYSRISDERTEFLNFLLAPQTSNLSADGSRQNILKAA